MTTSKDQAGTCPCPVRGCEIIARVFKFKAKTDNPKYQRMAGKFYCQCDVHGTIGMRGDQAIQEYILENGEIYGANKPEELAAPAAAPARPAAAASKPTPAAPPAPAVRRPLSLDDWMGGK